MAVNCKDFATLTVTNAAAVGLDDASPTLAAVLLAHGARAIGVIITVEDAAVRWRADGTDPTTSEGHELADTDILEFDSWTSGLNWKSVLKKIRFMAVSSNVKLKISYFG